MWHTHPDMLPVPSDTDLEAMDRLVHSAEPSPSRSLLLIVGAAGLTPMVGTYVFHRTDFQRPAAEVTVRPCAIRAVPSGRPKPRRIGLALSGGGSRAIAFHLGCLRALHDRGILDQIEVISAVSGGAVITGMYAYSHDSFSEFDARVVELLRRGLAGHIARRAFLSPRLPGALGTAAVAGVAALGADLLRPLLRASLRRVRRGEAQQSDWPRHVRPPFRRWVSRTSAFQDVLRDRIFGSRLLTDPRRDDLDVLFNACELRTGSAFRFGNRASWCWRYGRVLDDDITVAQAVAASAAYPILLPAIDRVFRFADREGREVRRRVLLTDGGVYDNLGVTCLEPGRSEAYSYHVPAPEYVICCDAGAGLFDGETLPYSWPGRMIRAFETVYRKVQDGARARLHHHNETGALNGFVLAYLGQQDDRLPYHPPDLVRRQEVVNYPTNFSPMKASDIDRLAARGEQLIRLTIDRHCREL